MLDELKEEQVITEREVVEKTAFEQKLTIKLFGDWKKFKAQRVRKAKRSYTEKTAECAPTQKRGRGRPRKNSEVKI